MEQMVRIDRKLKYEGAIVDVYEDLMESPTGKHAHWDYVAHRKGAAAVVPMTDDGKILMVRQYRGALNRVTLEIPAGGRDSTTEPYEVCARRELEEETGFCAGKLEPLITVATTVAFCNEVIPVFLATNLTPTKQHLDEDEFVEVEEHSLEELKELIFNQEIQDSKTVAAILAVDAKMRCR